ncbi:MAG: hypothetical protein UZ05_CHB002002880 [Chlorobi bacterium OLB5]|nr:MAG: hypothetical protein UZ05_CHB002002880 [Chlorobi bacterium OLB5]
MAKSSEKSETLVPIAAKAAIIFTFLFHELKLVATQKDLKFIRYGFSLIE